VDDALPPNTSVNTPAAWRRDIEQALHATVQSDLASLSLRTRTLARAGGATPADLDELRAALDAVQDQVREVARRVFPATLAHAGLGPTLRLLRRRADVAVDLDVEGLGPVDTDAGLVAHDVVRDVLDAAGAGGGPVHVDAATADGTLTLTLRLPAHLAS
jgi:signal transduction histidine kinase